VANGALAPQLIVLNGASSSGKSTLCRALSAVLAGPTIHLEEDRFVFDTVHARFLDGPGAPEIFRRTMVGYYGSLGAFLAAGLSALADTGFYTPELVEAFVRALPTETVWLVAVRCSLDELERRERARGDRSAGLARQQHDSIHAAVVYDIEVDTSESSPDMCAEVIRRRVEGPDRPRAMDMLRQRRA